MTWVLFLIIVTPQGDKLERVGEYGSMDECFSAWSVVENRLTSPKVDTQIICVNTSTRVTRQSGWSGGKGFGKKKTSLKTREG